LARVDELSGSAERAMRGTRKTYFPECGGFVETSIYSRYRLGAGDTVEGPAIVEERESTLVLLPGDVGRVDENGNVIVAIASRYSANS
jgi:N-methylhydantoinase A